jgi:hypothetical protein
VIWPIVLSRAVVKEVVKGKLSGEVEVFVWRDREAAAEWVAVADAGSGGGDAVTRLWVEEWGGGSGGRRCYGGSGGGGGGDQEPSGVCIPGRVSLEPALQAATKTGIALRAAQGPRHSGPLVRQPITCQQITSYHSIRTSCYYNSLHCLRPHSGLVRPGKANHAGLGVAILGNCDGVRADAMCDLSVIVVCHYTTEMACTYRVCSD